MGLNMKKKKTWNLMGLAVGIVMIIMGVVFAVSDVKTYNTKSPESLQEDDVFNTAQYRAEKIIADNTASVARNVSTLSDAVATYAGSAFIISGVLVSVYFGREFFCADEEEKKDELPEL